MNKPIKILGAAFTLTLLSCGGSTQVSESEARAQVAAMKETVNKDDFVTPTSGMEKTDMTIASGGNTLVMNTDLRFNVEKGSRYLYYKYSGLAMSTEFCQYEKDGKYYYYSSSTSGATTKEFSTEAEFTESFNEELGNKQANVESLKSTAVSFLDGVTNVFDGSTQTSSGYKTTYEWSFNKINDSSFTLDVTVSMTGDSGESGSGKATIEVENYLPKKRYIEASEENSGISMKVESSETYTWGSVDYVYPSAK